MQSWTLRGNSLGEGLLSCEEVKEVLDLLRRFVREEEGQGMAEYGLILALIAVVCIFAFTNLGDAIKSKLNQVITGLGGQEAQ